MTIFGKKTNQHPVEHMTQYWDQRLYSCLFTTESETQRVLGHHFRCQFSERTTEIEPGSTEISHLYRGRITIHLSEHEFCQILVDVAFKKPDEYFDVPMNDVTYGYASLDWATDERVRPRIFLQVKDTRGLSERVAQAYFESKATGGVGIEVNWSMVLSPIIGLSAKEIWGEWPNDSPRNEDGVLVAGKFPGLHAFQLASIKFSANS
jgi:hypothetical protein